MRNPGRYERLQSRPHRRRQRLQTRGMLDRRRQRLQKRGMFVCSLCGGETTTADGTVDSVTRIAVCGRCTAVLGTLPLQEVIP